MYPLDQSNSTFTKQELARLAGYRAAVAAGFYTDQDGSLDHTGDDVLAWLPPADRATDAEAYPFTPEERQRLERYRAMIAAGAYADDRPPAATNATNEDTTR